MKAPSGKVRRAGRGDRGSSMGGAGCSQAKGTVETLQGKDCHHLTCVPCGTREGLPRGGTSSGREKGPLTKTLGLKRRDHKPRPCTGHREIVWLNPDLPLVTGHARLHNLTPLHPRCLQPPLASHTHTILPLHRRPPPHTPPGKVWMFSSDLLTSELLGSVYPSPIQPQARY